MIVTDRTLIRYHSRRPDDHYLRERLCALAPDRRRSGCQRLHVLLREEGHVVNRKKTQRLCREEGRSERKRRARTGTRAPLLTVTTPNARCSGDFVHDQHAQGGWLQSLNVIDNVTKECLAALVDTSIPGRCVAQELTALSAQRGKPSLIVSDHGPEFTSNAILVWTEETGLPRHFLALGKPLRDTTFARRAIQRCRANSRTKRCSCALTMPATSLPTGWPTTTPPSPIQR